MVHLLHAYMSISSAFIHLTHLPKTQKNDNCVFRATRPYPANRYRRPPLPGTKVFRVDLLFFSFCNVFHRFITVLTRIFRLKNFKKKHSSLPYLSLFWDRYPKQTHFLFLGLTCYSHSYYEPVIVAR